MNNKLLCPHCKHEIEISEAFRHQIEEEVGHELTQQHKQELEEVRKKTEDLMRKRIEEEVKTEQEDLKRELAEKNKRLSDFRDQELELRRKARELEEEKKEMTLEIEKRLMEERNTIEEKTRKKVAEEHELKDREKDKKLTDALKQVEELKTKIQQGSQQAQGEVLELKLEALLKTNFPDDDIVDVKKGQRGADVLQKVIDKKGRECGFILWESKNAKWSHTWIATLRENQRAAKAQLAVLISVNRPDDIETFTYRDGIWISNPQFIVGLALALRFDLIHIYHQHSLSEGKDEKKELLFQYFTGMEFKHRIEAIVEGFTNLQQDIEREKRWFNGKWARQEKEIRKIVDNTHGMYGELQAATGRSLQQIKLLELESGE